MINGYKIDNDVLYIYMDFDTEFGKFNLHESKEKIEEMVKKFIRDNKILFTGTIVTLVVGSTILGNVYLNKENNDFALPSNNISINEIITDNINLELPLIINNDKISKEIIAESPKIENKVNSVSVNEVINVNESIEKENDNIDTTLDNDIHINVKRKNGIVLSIPLEEYVIGVVAAEMPASFNIEALKAQAILARTYALKHHSNNEVLTDTSSTQNYKDNNELKAMWATNFDNYHNKIKEAVDSTKGMYISYNGDYIEAVYHSTSNGMTEEAFNVWGNSYPYLISAESIYDEQNPSFIKSQYISYEELSLKLNMEINIDTNFDVLTRSKSNRILSILINDKIFKGTDFRNKLGLRSTDIEIKKEDKGITFITKGYGHGVGLSQYGANGYAKNGYSYIWILNHYYPGTYINKL